MSEARTTARSPDPGRPAGGALLVLRGMSVLVLALVVWAAIVQRGIGPLSLPLFVFTLIDAVVYWALATLVFLPRIRQPAVRCIWMAFLLYAIAVSTGDAFRSQRGLALVLPAAYVVSFAFLPVFFVGFAQCFPHPHGGRRRRRIVLGVFGAAAAFGCAHDLQAYFAAIDAPPDLASHYVWIPFVAGLAYGLLLLVLAARRAELARHARQVKWILWGIALGAAPYVLAGLIKRLIPGSVAPWPEEVDRISEVIIPVVFAIAIVRERVFDIDVIIRRSVLYSAVALALTALFAALVWVLGTTLGPWTGIPREVIAAAAAAIAVGFFVPLRRAVGGWTDRTFFKIRYRHDQALAALRQTLAPAADPADLARRLDGFLVDALRVRTSAVLVRNGTGWTAAGRMDRSAALAAPDALAGLAPETGVAVATAGATALPEIEPERFPTSLAEAGAQLAQPIARDGRLLGLMLLGAKLTGRSFVEEDIRLCSASALQAGRTLERMELLRKVLTESMAHKHLQDLAAQKADFFARVAHDLRTPLTAIHWSVRNLEEGLAGPLTESQTEYLASVGAAERQLGRLVDNLVDLSRLDLDAAGPAPEAVDLREAVRDAMTALGPIAGERSVHFAVSAPDTLPPVRGRPEAAAQIVMNLLDNALKYAPAQSAVEVELRADGGDVVLTVRDHGRGLPEEDRERLFDLFRQGPDSDEVQRKGFGIGLHIVKAWTASMDGSVAADNHPEGGARFTCRLPVWRGEEWS